jgi:hypothetical protein
MGNKTKTNYASFRGIGWLLPADSPYQQALFGAVTGFGFSRIGADNPRFKAAIRLGLNASNNMSVTVSNGETTDLRHEVTLKVVGPGGSQKIGKYGYNGVSSMNHPPALIQHEGSSSMAEAKTKAIRQLQKVWTTRRRQFSGIVAAGELGKSVAMVLRPAKTLAQKAKSLSSRLSKIRKRGPDSPSTVKVMADTWLETTFGWKPLISDVKDGAIALARTAERDALERQQFRCFGEDEKLVLATVFFTNTTCVAGPYVIGFQCHRTIRNRSQVILYGAWSTKLRDSARLSSNASRLATLSGLNWEDVAPQVWELVPWSFLVDYFINIGDVIESACNVYGQPAWVEEVDINETEEIRSFVVDHDYMRSIWPTSYAGTTGPDVVRKQSYKSIVRKASDWNLQSELSFRLPVDVQWLNIAALAAGGRSFQSFSKR